MNEVKLIGSDFKLEFMHKPQIATVSDDIFQDVLENISIFSGTLTNDGIVLSLTGKVFERTETNPALLIGQKFSETVYWQASETVPAMLENAIETAAGGEKTKVLLTFRVSAEESLEVELYLHPFVQNEVQQIYFCASEELSKIYESARKARDEAEQANRMKDYFLAIVSHELRSPLNAILGWTKILRTKKLDEKTTQNALETIERSANAQAKLIADLVDSGRIASGKMRLEMRPTNLYEILKTVGNSHKPQADAKNIRLEFTADRKDSKIFGDMIRLQQVFNNLVSNSIKFTPKGGKIEIKISTENEQANVSVKDTGQGISAESLPTIFSQFSQGDEMTSGDQSGLGLGLSITKILVEKHNGTIFAASAGVGKGTTFTIRLPLHLTESDILTEIKESAPMTDKILDGIRILIVEDDSDSRQVLQLVLEQSGATVKTSESAKAAFELLKTSKSCLPDVIISDLAMPEEDGYTFIKRIRQLPEEKGGKIPAIALSAFSVSEKKQKALEAGFQKYHTKPFEPDGLIEDILACSELRL